MALFFNGDLELESVLNDIENHAHSYMSSSEFLSEIEKVLEETHDDFDDQPELGTEEDNVVTDEIRPPVVKNTIPLSSPSKQKQQIVTQHHAIVDNDAIFPVNKLHYKMLPEETPLRTWEWQDIEWKKSIYLLYVHMGAVYGLYLLITDQVSINTCLLAISFYILGGLGITAGAHRLWTHRSYEVVQPLEFFLMICNSIANQGSIFHWCRDHVVHHKFSESIADPHDARRGFFFSHMGWLLVDKQPEVVLAGQQFQYTWLTNNWIVMHQKRYYVLYSLFCCFILPAYICSCWDDWWGGLWVAGFLRYTYTLHCTWTVNSLAHLHGERPYDPTISPSESKSTAFFSMGEGWHNYHHTYPRDYACSEFGICQQYNPTKLFIDMCAILGLVKNRKRCNDLVHPKHE